MVGLKLNINNMNKTGEDWKFMKAVGVYNLISIYFTSVLLGKGKNDDRLRIMNGL